VRFIYDNEVEAWAAEHGLSGTEACPLRTILYHNDESRHRRMWYDPGTPEAAEPLAAAMIRALGEWDEAVLWLTRWLVWPSSENWPAYYAARGARGELRSIDDKPGHLFAAGEQDALVEFATFALRNGGTRSCSPPPASG